MRRSDLRSGGAWARRAVFGVLLSAATLAATTAAAPDLTAPALPRHELPAKPDVRILSSSDRGISFDYVPGTGTPAVTDDARGEARFLDWDGAWSDPAPGTPAMPVVTQRIVVPNGSTYHVDFSVDGDREVTDLRFPTAPARGRADTRKGITPIPAPPDEDRLYPESPVAWSTEEFRGVTVLLVSMAPAQFNPGAGTTRLFGAIHVRVTFSGGPPRATAGGPLATSSDPALRAMLDGFVLNPDLAAASRPDATRSLFGNGGNARGALAPKSAGVPDVYFDDAPQWVKIPIKENAFYKVTGADLAAAGVSIAGIDPATIRVFSGFQLPLSETVPESDVPGWGDRHGFREVCCTVKDGGTAGHLDATDEIFFFALGPDNFQSTVDAAMPPVWFENEHTDATVTWITWGGTFPTAPLRIPDTQAPPQAEDRVVTTLSDVIHVEKNDATLFDPVPYEQGIRWEKWWWQQIQDTGVATFWDVTLPDVDTSRPASFFIRWWGSNSPGADPVDDPEGSHFLNVTVGDPLAGGKSENLRWQGSITRHDQVVPGLEAKPSIRVTALVPRLVHNPNRVDQILLAWFEVTYGKKLSLAKNYTTFSDDSAGTGPVQIRIAGAQEGAGVYDVTDPGRPTHVVGTFSGSGADRTLSFRVANTGGHHFAALNPSAVKTPSGIQIDARPSHWLRDTGSGVDYLVITWDEFESSANQLATWRRTHIRGITETRNARTAVVRVTDIYDEFSGGMVDPSAIRNFIQYVYYNWGAGEAGLPPISYLCLVGDANRDTRDREMTGVRNLIPTWQGGLDNLDIHSVGGFDQYSSDDYFGRLQGPNDRLTDIVIGRIPVTSPTMARQIIEDKIIHSEQFPGFNPRRNRAVLVADDVCQIGRPDLLGVTHTAQSEAIARTLPSTIDVLKVYLVDYGGSNCAIQYKPNAKKDLIQAMNDGACIVNYIGHGSDQQMADEKVFEVPDVTTLRNLNDLPILIAASCSVGKFDRANTEGLAEVLIKDPTGGAIATMAATNLSDAFDNGDLNPSIIRNLFPTDDVRSASVGYALWLSKREMVQSNPQCASFTCDREKKYLILGDPASVLVSPDRLIRLTDIPDTLERGARVSLSGDVLDPSGQVDTGFKGNVDLLVQDQPEQKIAQDAYSRTTPYLAEAATIFDGTATVAAGHFTATFVVPVSLRGGAAGRIRAYAAGDNLDAAGSAVVAIGGTASALADSVPPLITLRLTGTSAAPGQPVEVTIEDASGINLTRLFEFRSVQFFMTDDQDVERFRTDISSGFKYAPGSYTKGAATVALPELAAGHYTLHVSATDNYNNRGEGTMPLNLAGAGSTSVLGSLYSLPNPFAGSTQISWLLGEAGSVRLSIFSVGGRKVREWSVEGTEGENRVPWDGTDARGDQVANGVYLVRIAFKPAGGGGSRDIVEPVVRIR